ncbi:ABC transporter permease subunit [Proteiniclasticum sp. C24MP]|uniref:ABC transporter permease subunit n=1 Tax=Proteiniclasticum sp. C24MP TaxID=3374101 RepID=UPI0037548505
MKKINYPLLIGGIILLLLLLLSYFPEIFTSRDPIHEEPPRYIEYRQDGEIVEELSLNPMRPNNINIMGTDDAGRDIYARLVYGSRNTLRLGFLIALFRMIVALPLGILAGMGNRFISAVIKFFSTFFSAVPMLIFSFVLLNFNYFYRMQIEKSIIAFAVVLTIVGWSKLAGMLEDATKKIMEEDFIEGEIAIGKTKLQIVLQNVVPHVIPTGVSLFFKEIAMALFLVAQLAVLYVFVGSTREVGAMAFRANYRMGLEPEWGGMLSRITTEVMRFEEVWWVSFFPVLFFAVAIMGINLLGEGLRMEFQKRDSRVISIIRKTFAMLSPKLFYLQLREFPKYYRPILLKTGTVALILVYLFVPRYASDVPFQTENALENIEVLSDSVFEGRVSGSRGGYEAGNYIIDTMEDNGYDVSTMDISYYYEEEQSLENLKIMAPMVVKEGQVKITDLSGDEKIFRLHEDFTIFTLSRQELILAEGQDFHYKGTASDKGHLADISMETEVFPIEERYIRELLNSIGSPFSENNMRGINVFGTDEVEREFRLQFMLLDEYESRTNAYLHKSHTIFPFQELREILEAGYADIEVSFSYPELPDYEGRVIEAFLPGKDLSADNPGETIVIGAGYDGIYDPDGRSSVIAATPAATALEIAREVAAMEEPLERSVSFVFWDNQMEIKKITMEEGSEYYHREAMKTIDMVVTGGYYYYEVGYAGVGKDKDLSLVTFPAQGGRKPSYLIGTQMEKLLKDMKMPYRRFQSIYANTTSSSSLGVFDMVTRSTLDMRLNAFFTVGIGQAHVQEMGTEEDTLSKINRHRLESIGQVMLDNLTMNPYLMEDAPKKE